MTKILKAFGLSRSRDKKGNVVRRNLNDYVNCLHTQVGGARENMEVYVYVEELATMEDQLFPINTESDGTAHTANFERSGSYAATGVAEVVAEPQVLPHSQWKEQSLFIPEATKKGYAEVPDGGVFDASYPESATRRGRVQEGGSVSPTLTTQSESALRLNQRYRIRKLTPRECFRLMGVNEKDIDTIQDAGISNSQQYKMAGNSIVVDVLEDIFRELFRFNSVEDAQ